jgi:uncharacterized protein (TIGR03066 family)
MNARKWGSVGMLVFVAGLLSGQETKDKFDASKLVGTWTLVKADIGGDPERYEGNFKIEFTREGKMMAVMEDKVYGKSRGPVLTNSAQTS